MLSQELLRLDIKLSAMEKLERLMKYCRYEIVSCDETGNITLYYDFNKRYFVVGGECGFPDLATAIARFAILTEH